MLLFILFILPFVSTHIQQLKSGGEHDMICRSCGKIITKGTFVIDKTDQGPSPGTIDYEYEMAVGGTNTTIHVFTNPAGKNP
ncbi:hypothetical protein PRIPAC_76328 [Pristionchus pacificus]|uniref:Uncharacterized protein n=1 Tax=Pristionchus pacificus TaxID=54126 RepID=A0A2A6B4G0_PRIPA|nr:hypothetical protein PRIPAC_76328 [Pristionchus pacificus]|eukprot:PDM60769.1 hypothetical protein PRIPAC_54575 [Pristionchus pacificus]